MTGLPDAAYLVLASRLVPDLDGGFTVSVMRRARDIRTATGRAPLLLTVDPGETATHDAHRSEWVARGLLDDPVSLRNLFDDARRDPAWLRSAALSAPSPDAPGTPYRAIADAAGRTVLEIPFGVGGADWHLTDAPVRVWDGASVVGWLPGYRGLYRAWLAAVAAEQHAATGLPVVVVCEARQIGELLVDGDSRAAGGDRIRIVHTTHACHVRAPFTRDAPVDAAWERWLRIADRFEAVAWLTDAQRGDVERRWGPGIRSFVVPHPAPPVAAEGAPIAGRIVMLNSLIARKRVDHALRAFARVRETAPEARLVVFGEGGERAALEALAAELGLADAVELRGHAPDPEIAWEGADAFLFTSANEGQGLVLLEALAHGVPVVAYDVPYGPREALQDGGGLLVGDGDVAALAEALAAVVTDRGQRERLAAEGRRAAGLRDAAASLRALGAAVRAALA